MVQWLNRNKSIKNNSRIEFIWRKIVLIAGGYDKHLDYTPIAKPIVENVSALVLVGATTEKYMKQ